MNKSIGQVAKEIGVTPQTIRKWELMGLIPQSKRESLILWRVWTDGEVEIIKRVAKERRQGGA